MRPLSLLSAGTTGRVLEVTRCGSSHEGGGMDASHLDLRNDSSRKMGSKMGVTIALIFFSRDSVTLCRPGWTQTQRLTCTWSSRVNFAPEVSATFMSEQSQAKASHSKHYCQSGIIATICNTLELIGHTYAHHFLRVL